MDQEEAFHKGYRSMCHSVGDRIQSPLKHEARRITSKVLNDIQQPKHREHQLIPYRMRTRYHPADLAT